MPSRTDHILESMKANMGTKVYEAVLRCAGNPEEKAAPRQQAKYIGTVLDELVQIAGEASAIRVMRPCGGKCISAATIAKAKSAL